MSLDEPNSNIPLAEAFAAANGLVQARLIENWALGGALAAIYYLEPFATYDADIFFIPSDKGLSAGIPAIYSQLESQGWRVHREHLMVQGFPIQFLAASGITEEAVHEALTIQYEGVTGRIFRVEHIMAIAASIGRHKDLARIEQIREEADFDEDMLKSILQRYRLKLPN